MDSGWMNDVSLKFRLEYAVLRLFAFLFGCLSVERASTLSGKLWSLVAPLLFRHQRAIRHLSEAFPNKSAKEIETIARDMWECLGRTFAESLRLNELFAQRRLDSSAIVPVIAPYVAQGKGMVICGAHQGNWEVGTMGLIQEGVAPFGLYQRVKNPLVDDYLHRLREPFYPAGLFAKSPDTAMKLMRQIKRGHTLAILGDLRDRGGLPTTFFGQTAYSTAFPAMLARHLDVPLIVAEIVRHPDVRFTLTMQEIDVPRTDDKAADIAVATQRIQDAYEASIRKRPEQWMWAHQRWN
jgi:KDO2-lipid IV(A) lauroyltransferase